MESRLYFFILVLAGILGLVQRPALAWNPDYTQDLPKQRRMCAERSSANTTRFYAISENEACPENAQRYIVVFGRQPAGTLALIPANTGGQFSPPLPSAIQSRTQLWHFTCSDYKELDVLETKQQLFSYRGEITSPHNQDCSLAKQRALDYCEKNLQGKQILEDCNLEGRL